ncbi:unnamed protein product [Musa banksii]
MGSLWLCMLTEYGVHMHMLVIMLAFMYLSSCNVVLKSSIFAGGHELGLELDLIYRRGFEALHY